MFPIPGVALFPGELLPIHVFEPRYIRLIRDVLSRHSTLSLVHQLQEESETNRQPALAPIAGVGTIVSHVELPGGRFNIVVRGRGRVRLQELTFEPPYRRAMATLIAPQELDVPELEMAALRAAASAFAALVRERDPGFDMRLPTHASPDQLADACAARLVLDARERQLALEELNPRRRIQKLTEVLTVQRVTLNPRTEAPN